MSKKILIIDDDADILATTQELLEMMGYEVIASTEGKKVPQIVEDNKPDLVILDILMPDMNGGTIAANLKLNSDTREIPIVFLTGFIDKESQDELQKTLRSVSFLSKPFTKAELENIVKESLESHS